MYSLAKMLNRKVYSDDQFSKSIQCGGFLTHDDGNIKEDFMKKWNGITHVNTPEMRVVNLILLI